MPRRFAFVTLFSGLICLGTLFLAGGQTTGERITPGMILVAGEKLGDPHFAETVVLITRCEADGGTMGVILNRPMDLTIAKAFPQMHGSADLVYDGGPVSPDTVQALLRTSEKLENAEHVLADIYSVTRKAPLEKSINERLAKSKFRVYLGYAGWGPGQLENELRMGAWSTVRGAKYVFDGEPGSLWQRLNRDSHSQLALNRFRAQ
jgi:putative transcriptional regulator